MNFLRHDGKRFGRLRVIAYHGKNNYNIATWFCECDCGGIAIVPSGSLTCGFTKSCGCYGKEHPSHTKHGGKGQRLYNIWKSMNERCNTTTSKNYKNYGGRGISICSEWKDYVCFRNWSIENGYQKNLSIDRIDNNGNYEPQNCRWATIKQQARNKRNTVCVEVEGKRIPLIDWCEEKGLNYKRELQRKRRRDNA